MRRVEPLQEIPFQPLNSFGSDGKNSDMGIEQPIKIKSDGMELFVVSPIS